MRVPESPPQLDTLLEKTFKKHGAQGMAAYWATGHAITDEKGRYVHWEKLKHLPPPKNLTVEENWLLVKMARLQAAKKLPLYSIEQTPFYYCLPEMMQQELHWLDMNAAGSISMDQTVANPSTRNTYLVSSLIEESISSSQLEGASTTRQVAKDMLISNRLPTDHSEQMIANNYRAMQLIRDFKEDDLTPSLILQIHRLITENTLDNPDQAGCLRSAKDEVHVVDTTESTILHTPPPAQQLAARLQAICDFANNEDDTIFIHPVIKAILLHFMIGYDHPFVDGNGRTARALFYWYMIKNGYWLAEFISISNIIKQAPVQYGKAYLHCETDGGDTTYFLVHQIEVFKKAVESLHLYLGRKAAALEETSKMLKRSKIKQKLNHRQLALLKHALNNPNTIYSIQEHQTYHAIAYQTARTDLLTMADQLNLLVKRKYGNSFVFLASENLKRLL